MCIIIVKPSGATLNKNYLKTAFESNSDGAGFAVLQKNGKIFLKKGFFEFDSFFDEVSKHIEKESVALLHCRIATHGLKDAGNTHPFVLSNDENLLRNTELETTLPVMAHNGIFVKTGISRNDILSDTQQFIIDYLSDPIFYRALQKSKAVSEMFSSFIGTNKIAILDPKSKEITMYGNFLQEDGIYYSNSGYKIPKIKVSINTEFDDDFNGLYPFYKKKSYQNNFYNRNRDALPLLPELSQSSLSESGGYCELCEAYSSNLSIVGELNLCRICADAIQSKY